MRVQGRLLHFLVWCHKRHMKLGVVCFVRQGKIFSVSLLCFRCTQCFVFLFLIVDTSAVDCLERRVSDLLCRVRRQTLHTQTVVSCTDYRYPLCIPRHSLCIAVFISSHRNFVAAVNRYMIYAIYFVNSFKKFLLHCLMYFDTHAPLQASSLLLHVFSSIFHQCTELICSENSRQLSNKLGDIIELVLWWISFSYASVGEISAQQGRDYNRETYQ